MRVFIRPRRLAALLVMLCLLCAPMTAFAKKGDKNYKRGLEYETAQQWEKAAQEYALALAADPSVIEYQLHYRRAVFNASQAFMQQGRSLAEQRDYIGAYNAFRQAYGYDPVNQLAVSEMERMLRLQHDKEEASGASSTGGVKVSPTSLRSTDNTSSADGSGAVPQSPSTSRRISQEVVPTTRTEQLRVIDFSGDLKSFIRSLAEQLSLNVIFDTQSFRSPRTVEIHLRDVTTAQALDYLFLQEGLFFQRLNRRTILVADQTRRGQYQQLVLRTFYLSNVKPSDAKTMIQQAIPPSAGRPQTTVVEDKDTNSLTVRDTAENVRLIGELLQSLDKDRAEVVMDVNIYEVSRNDLLQLGNQVGGTDTITLGGTSGLLTIGGSRQVAQQTFGKIAPTAMGVGLLVPPSALTAFQSRGTTRLVASTQIHAFNNEESSARIGRRVPVQTAQTFPFGTTGTTTGGTTGGINQGVGFNGGFPVFQYEPTGLTLKFTPVVFPNLDVQVKMSIESKDVLNPESLTPTFTERTIAGTARIQNNRTMLLASVAQDSQSNSRAGLPVLGLIPIFGRLFTSPRSSNNKTDVVMAVTPRVLRAPAVTPHDEEMRPSGTLQTPTNGSIEAMIQEEDRNDALAAARQIPKTPTLQLPDEEPPAYVPAPKSVLASEMASNTPAQTTTPSASDNTATTTVAANAATNAAPPAPLMTNNSAQPGGVAQAVSQLVNGFTAKETALKTDASSGSTAPTLTVDVAGKSQTAAPSTPATSNTATASEAQTSAAPAVQTSPKPAEVVSNAVSNASTPTPGVTAEMGLLPEHLEMRIGERQRLALVLNTGAQVGSALLRFKFDPRVIAVRGISQDGLSPVNASAPSLMQSVDPSGLLTVTVSPRSGASIKNGASILFFVDIEAMAAGESGVTLDKDGINLVTTDGRSLSLRFAESRLVVKQ